MTVEHDRAYGSEPLQKLDVYIPANTMEKQLDVVVFFLWWTLDLWGQGRLSVCRSDIREEDGFVVVIPDYRKYPQVRFPSIRRRRGEGSGLGL